MKRWTLRALISLFPAFAYCASLDDAYLISYGNPNAPIHITEYFSFSCPYCVQLFCDDFLEIKERYLDTGDVYWTFHPVPADLSTVQAMACLDKLTLQEKRVFLEEILREARENSPIELSFLMEKITELCGCLPPSLRDTQSLEATDAFTAAFLFISGGLELEGVPCIALNGDLLPGATPDLETVNAVLGSIIKKEGYACAY